MTIKRNRRSYDDPQFHTDHPRPVTRRELLSQGFMTGAAYTVGGMGGLFAGAAHAQLAPDVDDQRLNVCRITDGAGKIPFICFDLAGGANIANSNVLVGGQEGQQDFISTAGYEKMGLPGDQVPGLQDVDGNDFTNNSRLRKYLRGNLSVYGDG